MKESKIRRENARKPRKCGVEEQSGREQEIWHEIKHEEAGARGVWVAKVIERVAAAAGGFFGYTFSTLPTLLSPPFPVPVGSPPCNMNPASHEHTHIIYGFLF